VDISSTIKHRLASAIDIFSFRYLFSRKSLNKISVMSDVVREPCLSACRSKDNEPIT